MERWVKDDSEEGETRWENIQELLSVTHKYASLTPKESLTSFLEEVTLVSEVDKLQTDEREALTLMTLHLCKGLEFSSVTVVGCEEGLLPHSSALFDREQLEEERRLLYVGMTRAKDTLTLTHAMSRSLWGSTQSNARSRFLDDIPETVLDRESSLLDTKYGWLMSSNPQSSWVQPSKPKIIVNEFSQESLNVDDSQEEAILEEGSRIEHKSLGLGTVLKRSGDIVEVRFDAGATKKLALSIAPMKVVFEDASG